MALVPEIAHVAAALRQSRSRWENRKRLVPVLAACGLSAAGDRARLLVSDSDALVVALPNASEPSVLKIATSPAASVGLDRHAAMLAWLPTRLPSGPVRDRVPRLLERHEIDGLTVLLESWLPGCIAADHLSHGEATGVALPALAEVHAATAQRTVIDAGLMHAWVDRPLADVRRLESRYGASRVLNRLGVRLHEALEGQELVTGCVHNDYWTGNVLVDPTAAHPTVTGIVDWENAQPVGLPDVDLVHWWLSGQPGELGTAVCTALSSPQAAEAGLAALPVPRANPQLEVASLVLLTWLEHISAGLTRATRNRRRAVWLARNVKPVLSRLTSSTILAGAAS